MAKVNAPLFSFGASGKLAKSLVFMKWKGIADVRQWVVPANPKSAGQVTQRGYLTDAVAEWHDTNITGPDKLAWASWAAIAAKPLSGFNKFVKEYIRIISAGDTWNLLFAGTAVAGASGEIVVDIDSVDETTVVVAYYGLKKTLMLSSANLSFAAGTWSGTLTGLIPSAKYYIQLKQVTAGIEGISGIYDSLAG